jgi:hypothetical protein
MEENLTKLMTKKYLTKNEELYIEFIKGIGSFDWNKISRLLEREFPSTIPEKISMFKTLARNFKEGL